MMKLMVTLLVLSTYGYSVRNQIVSSSTGKISTSLGTAVWISGSLKYQLQLFFYPEENSGHNVSMTFYEELASINQNTKEILKNCHKLALLAQSNPNLELSVSYLERQEENYGRVDHISNPRVEFYPNMNGKKLKCTVSQKELN